MVRIESLKGHDAVHWKTFLLRQKSSFLVDNKIYNDLDLPVTIISKANCMHILN